MRCPKCHSSDSAKCWCTHYDYHCLTCGTKYHVCSALRDALIALPLGETKYFRCPGNHEAHLNGPTRREEAVITARENARKKAEYDALPYHTQGTMMRRHAAGQLPGT